jgi:hypothetical protein
MNSLVIGNGESRKNVDLSQFIDYTLVGCNAIHRDMCVDHLICCDMRMVREALKNPNNKKTIIYTRKEWLSFFPNVKELPDLPYTGSLRIDNPFHWNSGPYALLIAATMADNITLVGFDLWGNNNKVNNIYKNTSNYSSSTSNAVDPNYWIYQIKKIFEFFPNKNFTILNNPNWDFPKDWQKNNVSFLAL